MVIYRSLCTKLDPDHHGSSNQSNCYQIDVTCKYAVDDIQRKSCPYQFHNYTHCRVITEIQDFSCSCHGNQKDVKYKLSFYYKFHILC